MRRKRLVFCYALVLACSSALAHPARAEELQIAVAANFLGTLQKLAGMFKRVSGHDLVPIPGATGQLYAQIAHGAPFDVLLSADTERPAKLETEKLGVRGTRFTYAQGKLVLWSPKPGVLVAGGKLLKSQDLHFVSIADPKTAPYGAAAEKVLTALGVLAPLRAASKLTIGESIGQAYQFAASGNADCAFVALSQVIAADGKLPGSAWIVPAALYGRLDQDAILLTSSKHPRAARGFLDWLHKDPKALAMVRAAGYAVPSH
jgi:molybdate transport system substrate-binding protein